jgi:hypothetical protein
MNYVNHKGGDLSRLLPEMILKYLVVHFLVIIT